MAAKNITELHESMGSDIDAALLARHQAIHGPQYEEGDPAPQLDDDLLVQVCRFNERASHEAPFGTQPEPAPLEPAGGWNRA